MRISTAQIQNSMLSNLQNGYSEYGRLAQQIATGKRILQPSDDVIGSVQLIGLQREQSAIAQYQKNIFNAQNQLAQAETQLDTMVDMLQRVRELTQSAANGSVSAGDRAGIIAELSSLRDGLFDLANARNESGSSLFAGSQVDKPALVKDEDGNYIYQGDDLAREVVVGNGVTVSLNEGADKLFLDGGDFFKQFDEFIILLEDPDADVSEAAGAMLDRSLEVLDDVSSMISRIGAKVNLLDQLDNAHSEMNLYSQEVSNEIESLDYADAVTRQYSVLMVLQLQQQSFSKINSLSLFNYMP